MKGIIASVILTASCMTATAQIGSTTGGMVFDAAKQLTFSYRNHWDEKVVALVTCDIADNATQDVACTVSAGVSQIDFEAALKTIDYSGDVNPSVRWALKMAWKLANPEPVMCTAQPVKVEHKPACPAGWSLYTETPIICPATCMLDGNGNICLNTCGAPKYSCRRMATQ